MMIRNKAYIVWAVLFMSASSLQAQVVKDEPQQFAINNPDGQKYEFVKTYIMALEYIYENEKAKERLDPLNEQMLSNVETLTKERDRLATANVNVRIALNLLENFDNTNNALMLKVVDLFVQYAQEMVTLNNENRTLVIAMREAAVNNQVDDVKIQWFVDNLTETNERRKVASLKLLEASMFVQQVLISNEYNTAGEFYKLGVTDSQRQQLLNRLNIFEGEAYTGEVRAGQTFLQASVSAIREQLEEESWETLERDPS